MDFGGLVRFASWAVPVAAVVAISFASTAAAMKPISGAGFSWNKFKWSNHEDGTVHSRGANTELDSRAAEYSKLRVNVGNAPTK